MSEIRPFQAIHYPFESTDFSKWIAPPYDIISNDERNRLLERDPRNSIRLILGDPNDPKRYQDSLNTLERWLKDGTLLQDSSPSYFVMEDRFRWFGKEKRRLGLLAIVRLPENLGKEILPHERTLSAPIEDRYRLMTKTHINESPVYLICKDEKKELFDSLHHCTKQPPSFKFQNQDDSIVHRMWKVESLKTKNEPLLIADGHHRISTSLQYAKNYSGERAKWVLSFIAPANQEGVVLGAIHRICSTKISFSEFMTQIKKDFELETKPISFAVFESSSAILAAIDFQNKKMILLKKKHPSKDSFQNLPSVILNEQIFKPILGIDVTHAQDQEKIEFVKKGSAFLDQNDPDKIGFWLKPISVEETFSVAESGKILPQKSTYFYPKIMTGFAFYSLK